MYGVARPEYHRIKSFQEVLPHNETASEFTYYEPQACLLTSIFSGDAADDFNNNAKVYVPDFN
jgi:hypothetical protein